MFQAVTVRQLWLTCFLVAVGLRPVHSDAECDTPTIKTGSENITVTCRSDWETYLRTYTQRTCHLYCKTPTSKKWFELRREQYLITSNTKGSWPEKRTECVFNVPAKLLQTEGVFLFQAAFFLVSNRQDTKAVNFTATMPFTFLEDCPILADPSDMVNKYLKRSARVRCKCRLQHPGLPKGRAVWFVNGTADPTKPLEIEIDLHDDGTRFDCRGSSVLGNKTHDAVYIPLFQKPPEQPPKMTVTVGKAATLVHPSANDNAKYSSTNEGTTTVQFENEEILLDPSANVIVTIKCSVHGGAPRVVDSDYWLTCSGTNRTINERSLELDSGVDIPDGLSCMCEVNHDCGCYSPNKSASVIFRFLSTKDLRDSETESSAVVPVIVGLLALILLIGLACLIFFVWRKRKIERHRKSAKSSLVIVDNSELYSMHNEVIDPILQPLPALRSSPCLSEKWKNKPDVVVVDNSALYNSHRDVQDPSEQRVPSVHPSPNLSEHWKNKADVVFVDNSALYTSHQGAQECTEYVEPVEYTECVEPVEYTECVELVEYTECVEPVALDQRVEEDENSQEDKNDVYANMS